MKVSAYVFALSIVGGAVEAQSMIDQLCGQTHISQTNAQDDVTSNPDGYYVLSLQIQLSHGDPRIVQAVGKEYHLCTQSAATPEMNANRVFRLKNERVIKYLFVPLEDCPKPVS